GECSTKTVSPPSTDTFESLLCPRRLLSPLRSLEQLVQRVGGQPDDGRDARLLEISRRVVDPELLERSLAPLETVGLPRESPLGTAARGDQRDASIAELLQRGDDRRRDVARAGRRETEPVGLPGAIE